MPGPTEGTFRSTAGPATANCTRTVLVTGGTGVVGQALLARFTDMNVICLAHRRPVTERPGRASIHADITQPHLGLSVSEYRALASRLDDIVHWAAVTNFNRDDGSVEATNVGGTENIVALAEAAGARLYHVSTAYRDVEPIGDRGRTAARYAASKREAEAVVRTASVSHVILRPTLVIGDSRTGEISSFQGFFMAVGAILKGLIPLIPFNPSWPLDFLPIDVIADAIAATVRQHLTDGELWITAGAQALSLEEAVAEVVSFGREIGLVADLPRFVPLEVYDRLIGPVFLAVLPPMIRDTVLKLLEFFAVYLSRESAFPSSLNEAGPLSSISLPDLRASLRISLRYWAEKTNRSPMRPAAAVG